MRRIASVIALWVLVSCGRAEPEPVSARTRRSRETVQLVASSLPEGALVTSAGRELGRTPLQRTLSLSSSEATLTFRLVGYETTTLTVAPYDGRISVTAPLAPLSPPAELADTLRVDGEGAGPILDHRVTSSTAEIDRDCTIDRLRVSLEGTHTFFFDLYVTLRDPAGRVYSLARAPRANPFRTHVVSRARGTRARGRWTLEVEDRGDEDVGELRSFRLAVRCR